MCHENESKAICVWTICVVYLPSSYIMSGLRMSGFDLFHVYVDMSRVCLKKNETGFFDNNFLVS